MQEPELGEGDSADSISQYPMEDMLDKFSAYISDDYKDLNTADAQVCFQEFAACEIDGIRALLGIIGKHVYDKQEIENGEEYDILVIE